uniref:Uncharacterized protein n=1 Tax=Nelumbo nucifera TaxID=4432 RepID=A0A822Z1B5_NELNU|nr:TPA_asm: hypothetical protein HUJ06_014517 [Nelumbo nucifera]
MFRLSDNLVLESNGFPWLVWLHLLVMFLLIVLLSYLGVLAFDVPANGAAPRLVPVSDLFTSKDYQTEEPVKNNISCATTNRFDDNKVRLLIFFIFLSLNHARK